MHLAGKGWLLRHLQLVLSQPMLLLPVSSYFLLSAQQASALVLLSFGFLALDAVFHQRSNSCFCWVRCNILPFCRSISSRRCFARRSSRCRLLDVKRRRKAEVLDVWEADLVFGTVLTEDWSLLRFRRAIVLLTSLFQNFVVFHSHVAPPIVQIIFQSIGLGSFFYERAEFFVFTKCFGHGFFTRNNQKFDCYFPICFIYRFHQLSLVPFQHCFHFSTIFTKFSHFLGCGSGIFDVLQTLKGRKWNFFVLFC